MTPEDFKSSDLEKLGDVNPHDWPDIRPAFEWYLSNKNCNALKFTDKGRMIAIGAIIFHEDTAWLAHIITHKGSRNQGLATKMTTVLNNIAVSKGCETVQLIATDLGFPVYLKCGFTPDTRYCNFIKPQKIKIIPESKHIIGFQKRHWKYLLSFDKLASGEKRAVLLWDHLGKALVFQKDKVITGFFLPELGNGFILARTPEAGIALMGCRLQNETEAMLPIDNTSGIDFLRKHQFHEKKPVWRMYWGKKPEWRPDLIYNRIGGNLG